MKTIHYSFFQSRTKVFCLVICFLQFFVFYETKAQEGIGQNPSGGLSASSNATSTGANFINVPLWIHNSNDASLPIGVGYNGTGVKVSDMSSWVGMGFNLNAGGSITREIRGLPDDIYSVKRKIFSGILPPTDNIFDNAGYLYSGNAIKQLSEKNINDTDFDKFSVENNTKDLEPDLFRFQFGGYSGSFMFDENGTPQLLPQSDLSISYEKVTNDFYPIPSVITNNPGLVKGAIKKFVITSSDGTKYTFEKTAVTTSYFRKKSINGQTITICDTENFYPDKSNQTLQIVRSGLSSGINQSLFPDTETEDLAITTWYLTNVKTISGNEINLTYTYQYSNDSRIVDENSRPSSGIIPEEKTMTWVQNKIHDWQLSKIESNYEIVDFVSDIDRDDCFFTDGNTIKPKLLHHINIRNKSNVLLKSYELGYETMTTTGTSPCGLNPKLNALSKRYRLISLTEKGKTTVEKPYSFVYNTTPLPPRHSMAQDIWGYFNGETSNTSTIPSLFVYDGACDNDESNTLYKSRYSVYDRKTSCTPRIIAGANRLPNNSFATAGVLEQVVYPTGGKQIFSYELNEFSFLPEPKYSQPNIEKSPFNSLGAGLRIKKITTQDGIGLNPDIVKEYSYNYFDGNNYTAQSSGRLVYQPSFGRKKISHIFIDAFNLNAQQFEPKFLTKSLNDYIFFNQNNSWLSTPIVYQFVKENFTNNGSILYKYSTPSVYGENYVNSDLYDAPKTEIASNLLADNAEVLKDNSPNPKHPNFDWNRGLLLETTVFDASNNKKSKAINDYKVTKSKTIFGVSYSIDEVASIGSYEKTWVELTLTPPFFRIRHVEGTERVLKPGTAIGKYTNVSAFKVLKAQTTYTYLENNSMINRIDYTYDNGSLLPKEIVTINSDGKEYKTTNLYSNYALAGQTEADPIKKLQNQNRNVLLETKNFVLIDNFYKQIGGSKLTYDFFNLIVRLKKIENYEGNAWYPKLNYKDYYAEGFVKTENRELYPDVEFTWSNGLPVKVSTKQNANSLELAIKMDYWDENRLIKTRTDVNGFKTYTEFDEFYRPKLTKSRYNTQTDAYSIVTNSEYKNGNNLDKYTSSVITFSDNPNYPLLMKEYTDGLGRPILNVKENYTPSGNHLKKYSNYDALGRKTKNYEPFQSSISGIEDIPIGLPYTFVEYDNSPINRSKKIYDEINKYNELKYETNISCEVRKFKFDGTLDGFYDLNTLYKNIFIDRNGNKTESFTDKFGRNILTRKYVTDPFSSELKKVDTYNVYNEYGNIIKVIPPGALVESQPNNSCGSSVSLTEFLCFFYEYDAKQRLIRKKSPSADWVNIFYNDKNEVVFIQDGNMRNLNPRKYLGKKYDELGREIQTGIIYVPNVADAENFAKTDFLLDSVYTEYKFENGKSRLIQSKVRVLGNRVYNETEWIITNYEYDNFGQIKSENSNNIWGKPEINTYLYSSGGQVIEANYKNTDFAYQDRGFKVTNVYDDRGQRLKKVFHQINPWWGFTANTQILEYNYNHLNQLIEKNIAWNSNNNKFLQSVDYAYNSRGWLTGINNSFGTFNPNATVNRVTDNQYSVSTTKGTFAPVRTYNEYNIDLFSQDMSYDFPLNAGVATPQYNGNISEITWRIADKPQQDYTYKYDEINRLKEAKYSDVTASGGLPSGFSEDNKYGEKVTYDLRGNITSVIRRGMTQPCLDPNGFVCGEFGIIDNLGYNYSHSTKPNQLLGVSEGANMNEGFKFKGDGLTDYKYDKNGNLVADKNKGITYIEYNYMNLPVRIYFEGTGNYIDFVYDATGFKHKKEVIKSWSPISDERIHYCQGLEYVGYNLDKMFHPEGYVKIEPDNGVGVYNYVLKDHLGNGRVTFSDGNNDGIVAYSDVKQVNNYYPFGMNMKGAWNGQKGQNKVQFNDQEFIGNTNNFDIDLYDYTHRQYDASIGRFLSVDALTDFYPHYAPYQFAGNQVPNAIDLDGLEPKLTQTAIKAIEDAAYIQSTYGNLLGAVTVTGISSEVFIETPLKPQPLSFSPGVFSKVGLFLTAFLYPTGMKMNQPRDFSSFVAIPEFDVATQTVKRGEIVEVDPEFYEQLEKDWKRIDDFLKTPERGEKYVYKLVASWTNQYFKCYGCRDAEITYADGHIEQSLKQGDFFHLPQDYTLKHGLADNQGNFEKSIKARYTPDQQALYGITGFNFSPDGLGSNNTTALNLGKYPTNIARAFELTLIIKHAVFSKEPTDLLRDQRVFTRFRVSPGHRINR